MGRPKYRITPADGSFARRWVETKLSNPSWLGSDQTYRAYEELASRPETAAELNDWCEEWLDNGHWTQLKNAIRAARKRSKGDDTVSVTLSRNAWLILNFYAEQNDCTLSEVIEKRFDSPSSDR